MRGQPRTAAMLWAIAGGALVCAVAGWRGPELSAPVRPVVVAGPAEVARIDVNGLRAVAESVAAFDPFRIDRRPAGVAFGTAVTGAAVATRVATPPLHVDGIVGVGNGGRRWGALLGGVVGHDVPVLVHAGDTVGGVLVRRVGRDTVVVQLSDSTWRLTVRQPWQ
jgi:hypothetical protein